MMVHPAQSPLASLVELGRVTKIMKSLKYYTKEAGVTLVELMVGMAVGFIVVGGIVTIYANTAGSSSDTIRGAILNQEMNAITQLVTNDLRRAGYWLDTNTTDTSDSNPFTDPTLNYNILIGSSPSGDPCITYAYDLNRDSQVGIGAGLTVSGDTFDDGTAKENTSSMELFGFRLNSGSLQMRTGGTSGNAATIFNCTHANSTWEALNDPNVITITGFTIDSAGTRCVDTSIDTAVTTPGDWRTTGSNNTTFCSDTTSANLTPNTTGSGDIALTTTDNIIEVRQINITLTGELASDSAVTKSLTRAISIRNNRLINPAANTTITIP